MLMESPFIFRYKSFILYLRPGHVQKGQTNSVVMGFFQVIRWNKYNMAPKKLDVMVVFPRFHGMKLISFLCFPFPSIIFCFGHHCHPQQMWFSSNIYLVPHCGPATGISTRYVLSYLNITTTLKGVSISILIFRDGNWGIEKVESHN